MFRRSRFSIRPNVGTAGRTPATTQDATSVNQEASENPQSVSESSTATAVTDNKSVVTPSEKPTAPGDGNDQNGEGTSSSAAVQRRKRFSIKPKVAPGRPSSLARTPKSPVKAVSETPVEVPCSELDKSTTSSQTGTTAAPQGLKSPRRRRPSEESKQPTEQPKPTLISSDNSGPLAVSPAEDSLEQIHLPADSGKQLEITSNSQVKEVPPRLKEKAPPSLPDKEHIEISEKAKTLVSSKSGLSLSPPAFSLSRLLNDPSDLQRLAKAQKLRELLRQEMHKEKKIKKTKARAKEFTLDPAKMTMRDLIRYLPVSNPMTSSLEDSAQENETVVPPSPGREVSPERAQELEVHPKIASPREEEEEEAEEEQEEALMVPQVKVAEDGSLIIDEESLTVEVQRAKGPNPAQERDPIFERGSTTTYSSFRKGTHSKPWSSEETDMFFLAVSMVGTDFSMICQLFPHRARSEIKNKFKKEERENAWRIDKAFRERRKLDIEYFSKLLDKIMEVQKNRKKLKSLAEKNSPKKHKRKAKGKAAKKLSDVEEENEEVENKIPDLEEEGEKENEDLCNEGGTPVSKPKKKRKRNNRQEALTEEPNDKKNKTGEKSNEQDDAYTPEDAEAALPEDCTNFDISDKTESMNSAKDTAIKPAKLSRGRAPKPVLPLGRKWGKKPPPPSTKAKDTAPDKGDESVSDEASKKQVDNDTSPLRQATKRSADDISSEEEDATVQPPRPTRYGRVPKPTKPLTYPAKESAHSSSSETTPASPGVSAPRPKHKCTAKRGRLSKSQSSQESKKPKLVTLRASQSEYSDEENENQWDEEEMEEEQHPACSSSKDSIAPVFVPVSLRSPHPVISEVEETMEELDILANIPDVLGISQDALCPDASFELAQNDTEPCEHQLDLLVDVIDFLSSEHTEASEDESYNEAAQTLLTIGNLAHLSQSAQNQIATQDHISGTTSVSVKETSQHREEEILSKPAAQEENSAVPHMAATPGHGVTETSETIATVELQNRTKDDGETSVLWTDSDMDPKPQLQSSPESSKKNSPKTRRGRVSKVKPKPNLDQASKTAQSKFQPETSTVRTAEESHTIAPQLSQATETAAKVSPKIADCSQQLLKDEIKLTKEPSSTQLEPILEQATRHSRSTSESKHDILMSNVGTTKSSYNLVTFDPVVTESHIGQGTNIDSAPVQESSDHPASCVTPAEDLPVSQKEESEETPTRQTRKSRFQKVKPKPNLTPTSRTVHSKPQTTKDTSDKDSNQTLNPKLHETTVATVELEAEPTCTASPEKPSQSTGPASDLIPSLDLGSNLTPTEELCARDIVQVESDAATSDHSASENRYFFDSKFESSVEQNRDARPTSTDEKTMSHAGTTESSCSNPLTSDSATGSQVGQDSNIESALVQESSDHPAPRVTPIEGLPVSQEEVMDIAPTRQTRKSRFQKVKPKPNLVRTSRTVHSKPQTTKDTLDKDSNPTLNPKLHETTVATVELEAEPTCTASPEKPSQSTGPASDLIPSLDLGSNLTPTEELCARDIVQVESDAATSDHSASENRNFFDSKFESSVEQNRDARPTSTDEKTMSHAGTTESSCSNPLTSDSATGSQVGQDSNTESALVQESSDHPAPRVTPIEGLPVSQEEVMDIAPTRQTRKSRFQKVKPKPNLVRTSRTVHSKPQTTKDTLDKDSNPTLNPKLHEKATVELEAEPTCTASPEKPSQSTGPASDLLPSLDLGSNLTPTEELCARDIVQVESDAATSDHSASENRNFFDSKFESSVEQNRDARPTSTDEKTMSHAGTTESSCSNPLTSDSATGSQVGQDSNIESALVQESSDHPAPRVTPIEGLPVSQEEVMDIAPTRQTRKSRFQKVKPKPNLVRTSRTVHSKPQTTKDTLDKDSNPTLNPKLHEKATVELEAEPTFTASPEKPSQSTGPASDLLPSLDLGSNLTPTEELCTRDIVQVESDAATSDQSVLENQNFSYAQFESSVKQDTRNTRPTSTDEKPMSQAGTTESTCSNPLTSCSATGSQVGKDSNIESAPVQESSEHPAPCDIPVEEVLVSQKEGMDTASTCQTRRGRLQKVKPKLSQISRTVWSKPQTTKDPVTYMLVEKPSNPPSRPESTDNTITEGEAQPTCSSTPPEKPGQIKSTTTDSVLVPLLELDSTHKSTEEFHSTEAQKTNVSSALDLNSEGSEQNAPQRRQRFPKVKPNLGSSTRTTQAKLHLNYTSKPSEQYHMDTSSNVTSEQLSVDKNDAHTELKLAEKNSKHLTSTHCSLHSELLSSTNLGPSESLDSTNDERTSSDCITIATSWVAENQSMLTDSVLEHRGSETPTFEEESIGDTMSNNDKVEAGPGSQWDCKQDLSIRVTATNTQLTDDPTAVSNVQSSEDGSTVSKIKSILPTYTQSKPDAKESTQQPRSENDSEVQSQDAVQQCSETTKTNQTSAQSDDNQSEKTDSSKSSRKAPQTRRGRLVKPKPNLAPSSRPPKPQQVRNTKKAGADSGTHSEGVDASVSHKSVSELRPDFQQPVEGPIEQQSIQNPHPNDAGSSIGCLTQAPDNSTQDASTSITGETQSLTIFPDLLSEQVPSDPDEPFFILSLTEIPVCSSGEVVDSVCEPFPYLPVTDTSIQQQSVLGESLAAAGHGSLSNVAVPVSMEESGETGLINVIDFGPDPAAYKSLMENPVDPHERTTVQSSEFPETVENIDESEIPPTTQRLMGTRRGAKLQVTPNTTTRMRASKTLAAKESIPVQANTTQDSELPGPSVQPKAINELITEPQKRSCEHTDIEKETLIDGKDHENSSSGAQTAQTRRTSSRNRKPEVLPAFPSETKKTAPSSDSPPGKASSKGRKVKTPRAAGKRSTQAPVASTYDVTPTPSPTLPQEETHLILPPTSPTQTEMDIKQTSEHSQLCSDPTYSTSQCTAEGSQVSDVVESSYIEEEEPTSVSQYFLSDIFTEVEEG
ncbi:transcription factor TFIIIB component B'' homolog isoform X2 [Micropterus salmoides]|uniref:transcription factor TFIIIB component B'' homolog isoform X2 n=1 Tax=Micropterus salmoides TaxID=27706 RepID=UPI0018EAF5BA|nr:transcription factor TFIIIB component B'' homolog isoform X2 [Micropterus salmoides]